MNRNCARRTRRLAWLCSLARWHDPVKSASLAQRVCLSAVCALHPSSSQQITLPARLVAAHCTLRSGHRDR